MSCGVKGCNRKKSDTFDHWGYELDLCEDGLRHIRAPQLMVRFAQGHVVTEKEWEDYLKPEAVERLFSPWERSREEAEEPVGIADSELFVSEDVRDRIADYPELKGLKWKIRIPDNWKEIRYDCEFPDEGTAEVVVDDTTIGEVSWETRFEIFGGVTGMKYIKAHPDKVEFKKKVHKGEKVEKED